MPVSVTPVTAGPEDLTDSVTRTTEVVFGAVCLLLGAQSLLLNPVIIAFYRRKVASSVVPLVYLGLATRCVACSFAKLLSHVTLLLRKVIITCYIAPSQSYYHMLHC